MAVSLLYAENLYLLASGTLFGAVLLLAANGFLRGFIGTQFAIKLTVALAIVLAALFFYRPFCRILCPLGAVYALLNRLAVLRMRCDKTRCVSCGQCAKACPIKLEPASCPNDGECVRCGRCVNVCAQKALSVR